MQFYQVKDFSGGIDDNFLSVAPNSCYQLNNFWVDQHGKLHVRPGLNPFVTRAPTSGSATTYLGLYLGETPYGRPIGFRADKVYAVNSTDTWTEIVGPAANSAAPNKLVTQPESMVLWQKQLVYAGGASVKPHRIYASAYSATPPFTATYKALTLGLPALATPPTVTAGAAGAITYIYAFFYNYTFTDYLGTVYEESGPEIGTEVTLTSSAAPTAPDPIAITDIPVLANTSSTNYDTAVITVQIYRTQANGTSFYKVGQVTNGTTVFDDDVADTTLVNNQPIYTDGGALDYDPPPTGAHYCTQIEDRFWYATQDFVTHSIQGAPGACPSQYYQYTEQKITALSNFASYPILFCDLSVYRVEGSFDEFGDDGFDLREISKTAGCISHKSIVAIPGGLVWAGNGAFYFTESTNVLRISRHIFQRYQNWANQDIVGTYDARRNIVFWTVSSSASSSYADTIAVLHLDFGISERSVFTTWSGTGIYPTTLAFSDSQDTDSRFKGKTLCMDYRGYLLTFDDLYFTDPNLSDDNKTPDEMPKKAVIYRIESSGIDTGQDATRKYCTQLTAEFETDTDLSTQFYSRRDDGGPWAALSEIRYDGAIVWNYSEYPWNGATDSLLHSWNSIPVTEGMRHLPSGTLRSNRRQIALTNSYTWITRSDILGLANVSATLKTVTLTGVGMVWPSDCEDYALFFALDTYVASWVIKSRDSDTQVTLFDPYGTLALATGTKWQMRGYRKFERPYLLSLTLWFDEQGEVTQAPSRGASAYINA